MPYCICLPNFLVIKRSSAELWRHIHFSRWRPAAILDLMWVMLDHPRRAIVGISSVLKFGLDPIYNFGAVAIFFIFCRFGLKLPIHAHYWGRGWRYIAPNDVFHRTNHKRHFLTRTHVVWAIKRENRFSGSTWARSREEKARTGQDSQTKKSKW